MITVKLRKPWTFGFYSKRLIWDWTDHNKVQDMRENLKTTTNRSRLIYKYSNIYSRFFGQNSSFLCISIFLRDQNTSKYRSLTWKFRFLFIIPTFICRNRAWPVTAGVRGFSFLRLNWPFPCCTIILVFTVFPASL